MPNHHQAPRRPPNERTVGQVAAAAVLLILSAAFLAAPPGAAQLHESTQEAETRHDAAASSLERRLDYEAARAALASGAELFAGLQLRSLAERAGSTAEGLFFRAALEELAAGKERRQLALAALEMLERQGGPEPWFFPDLLRLAGAERYARRSHELSQRLAPVLSRHFEARGGLKRLLAPQTMVVHGVLEVGDAQYELRMTRKRPAYYRLDLGTAAGTIVEATDGRTAWRRDPTSGDPSVHHLDAGESARLLREAPFDELLLRVESSGTEVQLEGSTIRDGLEVHRLELLTPDGERQTRFLDVATGLEVLREVYSSVSEQEPALEIRTEYADHAGTLFPSVLTVTSTQGMSRYRLEEYRFDVPVDAWWFDPGSLDSPRDPDR